MEQVIRITARLAPNPAKCTFEVDRVLFPEGHAYFPDRQMAVGSALAEKLFALPQVKEVLVSGAVVTVTQDTTAQWAVLAKECGAAIRAAIQGDTPVIRAGFVSALPVEEIIREKVQKVLDFEVNPAVASHGGFIEIVDVLKDAVVLKMGGGCQGCGSANATLYQGVAKAITDKVPEVVRVIDATDHAAGQNPYFAHAH